MTFAKDALAHRHAFLRHCEQRVAIGTLLFHPFFPSVLRTTVPQPPVFRITLPVERAFAGDRDVSLLKSINERRVVEDFDTLPTREDNRQVEFRVLTELDSRAF